MIERELELTNLDNLTLGYGFISKIEALENNRRKITYTYAFSPETINTISSYVIYTLGQKALYQPILNKKITLFGIETKIDVIKTIVGQYCGNTLYRDIENKYPKLAKELKKRISKNFFKEANRFKLNKSKEYKKKIQKQFNELTELFIAIGSKTDIQTMKDIDSLLYCEANTFMDKIEKRINKKSNPKNLRLYKELQNIRGKDIITCSEE